MRHLGSVFGRSLRRRAKLLASFVLAAAASTSSLADVVWIGQPTVRDYMAYNAQKAIEGYVELGKQMAQFEARISDARRAYFAAPASGRAAAGDRFGQMLLEKDLLIAWPQVMGGDDAMAKLATNLMSLSNNGRPPDGGIPPSARPAFNSWVSTMRMKAGSAFGPAADPVRAAAALKSGEGLDEYEKYRRLRDQAEWDEFEAQRAGGLRKLVRPGSVVHPRSYFGETPFMQGFDMRIAKLPNRLLQCVYAGRQAQGSVYTFWQGQAPEEIALLMAMNPSAFGGLKDHAVAQCPPDSAQASAIAASPASVVITPQMAKEARAMANSRPLDPAEAQAIKERNAAARQKADERKAGQAEKAAMFKACSDQHQADVYSARMARDNTATSAAHRKYMECQSVARAH
jgi:hypothetical protein